MRDIFIGVPTKEEIILYLKQRSYSLLNMQDLRSDILRREANENKDLYKNFFQESFVDTKRGALKEKTNRPVMFFYEGKRPTLSAAVTQLVECVDIAKVSNRTLRKITQKNTQKNTGYRYVKLQYKNKKAFFGKYSAKRENKVARHCSVTWASGHALEMSPHNKLEIKPILKIKNTKPMKEIKIRKKIKISVEAKVTFLNFDTDSEFKYTISRY